MRLVYVSHSALVVLLVVILPALFVAPQAVASLGDNSNTVEGDRQTLNGVVQVTTQTSFSVHEITLPNGGSVKEYVSNQGTVFAITWRGRVHPDLHVLLGNYHSEFQTQDSQKPKVFGRGIRTVMGPNVVVEKFGHMRDVRGRAYLPSLLPSGVSVEDLQ